jgi:CrcB protein
MSEALWTPALWVGVLGIGGLGAVTRFMVDRTVSRRTKGPFPFGTLVVNISGAALLGFLAALTVRHEVAILAGTAFLGAYTTFSTWMLQTQRLAEQRHIMFATMNIVISVVLGLAAAAAGHWTASML